MSEILQALQQTAHEEQVSLQNLLYFNYRFKNVRNITALQQLKKVKYLDLIGADILDISPLKQLVDIEALNLRNSYNFFNHQTMKRNNYIFIKGIFIGIHLLLSLSLNAQCPTSLFLQSQAEVDAFGFDYPDCDSVNTLIINGQQSDDYIIDLSPLSGITHVKWDLVIANNDSLESLGPLNITGHVGYLRVINNPMIENLEGLENITSTLEIKLHDNDALEHIFALSNLSGNNPVLDIKHNPKLSSLDGLQNLTSLSSMFITGSSFSDFEGLNNIQEIESDITIRENNRLKTLYGLNALSKIGGDTFEGEFFWLSSNDSLHSLSALSNVTTLNLNLEVFFNSSLETLTGLENIFIFGGALIIDSNVKLKSITAVDNWNILNGHLSITDNYQLDSCACTSICEYLNSTEWRLIEDNASGCNSETSILFNCPAVDNDNDGYYSTEDCNDDNPDVNPGEMEIPYNGIDDDCNPVTPDDDLDQDGFNLVLDCDDDNANINPGEIEIPYNDIDDDCNPITPDDDLDQDGFPIALDCDDDNASINPDAEEIVNNGIDEDCDGMDLVSSTYELEDVAINIYPNPANDQVYIVTNGSLAYYASLYEWSGKRISQSKNVKAIAVKSLPPGAYLLEIKAIETGQKIVEKIIVGQN
jgi:hypothetical protein